MSVPARRARSALVGLGLLIGGLFIGRALALGWAERWWTAAVDPAAVPFLTRWRATGAVLELVGITLAAGWSVLHLLLVTGSIRGVQVPRRLGDLEIRELLPPASLRALAIVAGLALGVVTGAGAGRGAGPLLLAWRGAHYGVTDPVFGADVGTFLVQLPLWLGARAFALRLAWVALLASALCYALLGALHVSRRGIAMTDAARRHLGCLAAVVLLVAAIGRAIAPLADIAGLGGSPAAPLGHWLVALGWAVAGGALAAWALRPWPPMLLGTLALWIVPWLAVRLSLAGAPPRPPDAEVRRVAALATGLDRLVVTEPPRTIASHPPSAGLWTPEVLVALLEAGGGRGVAVAPAILSHASAPRPAWLGVRLAGEGVDWIAIADDRLAPDGGPVSWREGDEAEYPGLVVFRRLIGPVAYPAAPDTVAAGAPGGLPVGTGFRRLLLAWGAQTPGVLGGAADSTRALWWRRDPQARVGALFPPATWDFPVPVLVEGRPMWRVDGYLLGAGAPFAPLVSTEWGERRYARAAFLALVDAVDGATRIYLRPEADALARAWRDVAQGAIAPAESLPAAVRADAYPARALRWQAAALQAGPFGLLPDSLGPRGGVVIGRDRGVPVPQVALTSAERPPAVPATLAALLLGTGGADAAPTLVRWGGGPSAVPAPGGPEPLARLWARFAPYQQLVDSVARSGGKLTAGPVAYDLGPDGVLARQPVYLRPLGGAPRLGWFAVATPGRYGAARTPAEAWANLTGASVPLVPGLGPPDALREARRWAARADSALHRGDLEGFARAFDALKRVLATP